MCRLTFALIVLSFAWTQAVFSQTPTDCACESQSLPETLANVNGVKITSSDVKKSTAESVSQLQQQVVEARKRELDLMINSKILELEAKKRGLSTVKLLDQEVVAKVKKPGQTEAQVFYEQNKTRIKGEFKDVAEEIIGYLYEQAQQQEAKKFADSLRAANEVKVLVTLVTPPATPADRALVLATIKGEKITSGDVEDSLLPLIFDVQQQVYKLRKDELELSINDALLVQEAQKRQITTNALLDAEVKPKPVTDQQAQAFYDQNKERVSGDFAQTKDAIRQYLEQIEVRQAERAFVEKLRAAATIQTFLVAPESPVFKISTTDQPSLGKADAPVTIVAFTDYQCPSCAAMHPELERLVKEYGDKVRLVTRDFPLSQHTEAFKAAEAAEAARDQGKYWEYIQILLRNQSALTVDKLKGYASELALDRARFDSALDSGKFAESVQRDIEDGMKLGINGTPTIFINGRRVSAKGYDELKAIVDSAFKAATVKSAKRT
ncbi:MAG TPA: thioredoxin domain-containing protein [Pyrinomonadaceae bacterium]|nr:thioredoxin domain-containing protein [Pyrinomonadaceae bacterium]